MTPELSVVLVSYGSRDHLERCLPSLFRERVADMEVLVVDNAPGDGTAAWLGRAYPDVRVESSPTNGGYAGGNNLGLAAAKGRFVLILNPDTELRPGALSALLSAASAHPDALVTAKLLRPDGRINACGLQMHFTGVTTCRGLGCPADELSDLHDVPLLSGAAIIARREVLQALRGFDGRMFLYLEDVDLSLRARLRGHRLLCAGAAHIVHDYALGMNATKFGYLQRNRLWMLGKTYRTSMLLRILPALLLTEAATWGFALVRGPAYVRAYLELYRWLWGQRRHWRVARRRAQAGRIAEDAELLRLGGTGLPFDQLMENATLARILHRATTPLYRLLRPPVQARS